MQLARVAVGVFVNTHHFADMPEDEALRLLAGLEGARPIARPYDDPARFTRVARSLLAALEAGP